MSIYSVLLLRLRTMSQLFCTCVILMDLLIEKWETRLLDARWLIYFFQTKAAATTLSEHIMRHMGHDCQSETQSFDQNRIYKMSHRVHVWGSFVLSRQVAGALGTASMTQLVDQPACDTHQARTEKTSATGIVACM